MVRQSTTLYSSRLLANRYSNYEVMNIINMYEPKADNSNLTPQART